MNQSTEEDVPLIPVSNASSNADEPTCLPYRYWLSVLVFFGIMQAYLVRMNFNIALVAMVNYTAPTGDVNITGQGCPGPSFEPNASATLPQSGEFDWGPHIQSELLSAFFYGYIVLQIPGGYLSQIIGPKITIGLAVTVSSLISFLSPWAAWWSPWALFSLRFCMGLVQGPLFPSNSTLWGRWAPEMEKTLLYSMAANGSSLGAILAPLVTGALCSTSFLGGWPLPFWLFGLTGIIWSVLWVLFAYDSPAQHPNLTAAERRLHMIDTPTPSVERRLAPPCPDMLLSRPVWALILYCLFDGISFYSMFSGVPIYMKEVLKFDIAENGVLNGLPYVGGLIGTIVAGFLADWLRKYYLSTLTTRRIFTFIGEGCQLFVMLGMGFAECNWRMAVSLYILSMFMVGLTAGGPSVNVLDIAPQQAGLLMGVTNFANNIGGFVGPLIVAALTQDGGDRFGWQKVFWLAGAFYFVGAMLFIALASGDVQPWARNPVEPQVVDISSQPINADDATESDA